MNEEKQYQYEVIETVGDLIPISYGLEIFEVCGCKKFSVKIIRDISASYEMLKSLAEMFSTSGVSVVQVSELLEDFEEYVPWYWQKLQKGEASVLTH